MRSKLHLSDSELMEKSWIALNLELLDFPYYNYRSKKKATVVPVEQTGEMLSKLLKQ
jgi:hypothetical protein